MKKWIISYVKKYFGMFMAAIFLGGLTVLFGGGLLFTSGYLISKAATRPESILLVYVPIVGVRTFAIGRAVLSYVERLTGHRIVLKILSDLRVRLYKVIEPQALFLKSRFLTGDVLGVLANDIEYLQDFYLKTIFPSVIALVIYTIIVMGAGAFSVSYAISLAVLMGILLFAAPVVSFMYIKVKKELLKQGRHGLYLQYTDGVFGIRDWLFSGRHADFIESTEKQQQPLLSLKTKIHSFVNWRAVINQVVLGSIVIVSVYWANGMVTRGEMPATLIAAVGLTMLSVVESFFPISDAVSDLSAYHDSVKRLEAMEAKDGPEPIKGEDSKTPGISDVAIELKAVSFHFPSGPSLLNNVSLKVSQGEKIAILGPSGSGKSTLLNLIQGGHEPTSGEVLFNGKKALSISKIMSVLNQKAYLFHTSVLNNIRLGNPEASDEEVIHAAKQVQLHDMIQELPDGYATNMLEAGQRFSGGERQRIALARILLQNTPVVIMDEPTVGLDPLTEKRLLSTIFQSLHGKTIIWVTHHLAGMELMDRILFMDKGNITMAGSHQQLLASEERYRRLYALDYPLAKLDRFNNIGENQH